MAKTRCCSAEKGANLCEMTQIGLNVPSGFTITNDACLAYLAENRLPDGLMEEVRSHIAELERKTGKTFGGAANPLLVSVRSGSAMSMPGMMDTILNLGLNDQTLGGLVEATKNARFAYDAWRRFIQLFGKIALGVPDESFDHAMAALKRQVGAADDVDLSADQLKQLAATFLGIVREATGKPFPIRALRATGNRDWRRVPLVDGQARRRLPPPVPHHARHGQRHGGEHRHHGFRQPGRRQCYRRWLYTQPGHR